MPDLSGKKDLLVPVNLACAAEMQASKSCQGVERLGDPYTQPGAGHEQQAGHANIQLSGCAFSAWVVA